MSSKNRKWIEAVVALGMVVNVLSEHFIFSFSVFVLHFLLLLQLFLLLIRAIPVTSGGDRFHSLNRVVESGSRWARIVAVVGVIVCAIVLTVSIVVPQVRIEKHGGERDQNDDDDSKKNNDES